MTARGNDSFRGASMTGTGRLLAATPVPRPSARPQQAAPRRQAEAEGLEPVSTGQLCAERCAWSMSRISRRSGSQSG